MYCNKNGLELKQMANYGVGEMFYYLTSEADENLVSAALYNIIIIIM